MAVRQVLDHVLVANELIYLRAKSGVKDMMLKLDITKAYNHVN